MDRPFSPRVAAAAHRRAAPPYAPAPATCSIGQRATSTRRAVRRGSRWAASWMASARHPMPTSVMPSPPPERFSTSSVQAAPQWLPRSTSTPGPRTERWQWCLGYRILYTRAPVREVLDTPHPPQPQAVVRRWRRDGGGGKSARFHTIIFTGTAARATPSISAVPASDRSSSTVPVTGSSTAHSATAHGQSRTGSSQCAAVVSVSRTDSSAGAGRCSRAWMSSHTSSPPGVDIACWGACTARRHSHAVVRVI